MLSSGHRAHEQPSAVGFVPDMEQVSLVHAVQKVAQPPAVEDEHPVAQQEAQYPAAEAFTLERHHLLHHEKIRQRIPDGVRREMTVVLRLNWLVDVWNCQEQLPAWLEQLEAPFEERPTALGWKVFEDLHQDSCVAGREIV